MVGKVYSIIHSIRRDIARKRLHISFRLASPWSGYPDSDGKRYCQIDYDDCVRLSDYLFKGNIHSNNVHSKVNYSLTATYIQYASALPAWIRSSRHTKPAQPPPPGALHTSPRHSASPLPPASSRWAQPWSRPRPPAAAAAPALHQSNCRSGNPTGA